MKDVKYIFLIIIINANCKARFNCCISLYPLKTFLNDVKMMSQIVKYVKISTLDENYICYI